jgi:hypothetical protein
VQAEDDVVAGARFGVVEIDAAGADLVVGDAVDLR